MTSEQGSLFPDPPETEIDIIPGAITITGSRELEREVCMPLFETHLTQRTAKQKTWFIGGARGLDTWALEWLLNLGEFCWAVVPFTAAEQPRAVRTVLTKATKVIELRLPKSKGAYIQRNHYMVDRSSMVIGFWSGKKGGTTATLEYAIKVGKEIHASPVIMP